MNHEVIVEIKDEDFHKYGLDGCREIIRCKDCKYYSKRNGHHYCYNYNGIGSGDAFCSYAERRTDG